jgi:hypothetical protein
MAQYSTIDQGLAQKLQKEHNFTVVSMSGKPRVYTFAEDEAVVMAKLHNIQPKENPAETKTEVAKPEIVQVKKPPVFIKKRGRPKSK